MEQTNIGTTKHNYRDFLIAEFRARSEKNRNYSLRAFARDLGLDPSKLSAVMRGTKGVSPNSALRMAAGLRLSEMESEYFYNLVMSEHSRSRIGKIAARSRLKQLESSQAITAPLQEAAKPHQVSTHTITVSTNDASFIDEIRSELQTLQERLSKDPRIAKHGEGADFTLVIQLSTLQESVRTE